MKKFLRFFLIGILFFLLLLIRGFEDILFYDPLIIYYKGDYKNFPFPEMNMLKLELNIAFRYVLNTIISLGVLWLFFRKTQIIKLSVFLYIILFVFLLIAFNWIFFNSDGTQNQLALFYVRRFLIHPVFLLIFVAAFYFQKKNVS